MGLDMTLYVVPKEHNQRYFNDETCDLTEGTEEVAYWGNDRDMHYFIISVSTVIEKDCGNVTCSLSYIQVQNMLQYEEDGERKDNIEEALNKYPHSSYDWVYNANW